MVEAGGLICHGCGQQALGQDHAGTHSSSVGGVATLADQAEAIAGSDNPGIGCGAMQLLAEIFKDGWVVGRDGGEVVESFVGPGYQACGRDIVTENPPIDYLGEERALRNELTQEMRDVFLPIGHEGLFISSASAKGNDDCFVPGA